MVTMEARFPGTWHNDEAPRSIKAKKRAKRAAQQSRGAEAGCLAALAESNRLAALEKGKRRVAEAARVADLKEQRRCVAETDRAVALEKAVYVAPEFRTERS